MGAYLARRGAIGEGCVEVEVLAGGLSSDVVLVRWGRTELVVKQALPLLRVPERWEADRGRIVTKGEATIFTGVTAKRDARPCNRDKAQGSRDKAHRGCHRSTGQGNGRARHRVAA